MSPSREPSYYFPPGESIARQVHGERIVGALYGQRALLIGALDPLTYTATILGTRSSNRPFRRLARTAKIQEIVLLGTKQEADEALRAVRRLHGRVQGRLPVRAGQYGAGTPYSALSPVSMLWTLAVIADSAREIYEVMVRPLSAEEREGLWRDYMRFGELFGLPREAMPLSFREFDAWIGRRLASPELQATPHAMAMAPLIAFDHPIPAIMRPGLHLNNLVLKGTLPERVRRIFGIRWTAAHEACFQAVATAHRRGGRALPHRIRRGRNDVFFDLVVRTERRRGGTQTPALEQL